MAKDLEKGEKTPLLSPRVDVWGSISGLVGGGIPIPLPFPSEEPITTYDPEELTNWRALVAIAGTVFAQRMVVGIIAMQFVTACMVVALFYYFVRDPAGYSVDTTKDIIKTITISIAFLLGLFLSACVGRWWSTIKELEKLFGAVKKLVMTAINLGLSGPSRKVLSRRLVLSIRMLEAEMDVSKKKTLAPDFDEDVHWKHVLDDMREKKQIRDEEYSLLRRTPLRHRSFFSWSLVSKELKYHRKTLCGEKGSDVLGYDRLCGLVQDGVAALSAIRTTSSFQLPYIYVHLLAFMVHLVNMLTAVSTGVTVGIMFSKARVHNAPLDLNALASNGVFLVVQAFVYQAFLTIGAALSFPLTGTAYSVPLGKMVDTLDAQLVLMNKLADEHDVEDTANEELVVSCFGAWKEQRKTRS